MNPSRFLLVIVGAAAFGAPFYCTSCGTPEEKTARLKKRLDSTDDRYYQRLERRRMRSERERERYEAWFDTVMGR